MVSVYFERKESRIAKRMTDLEAQRVHLLDRFCYHEYEYRELLQPFIA